MEEEPAQSHLRVEAFLALSTLDLCHRVACVVSGGTWDKGCSPGSSRNPAEQH